MDGWVVGWEWLLMSCHVSVVGVDIIAAFVASESKHFPSLPKAFH